MPRNPEQDRATVIAQALSRGMTTSQISGVMGISKRTVTRVSSNLKKYGTPKPPPSGAKQGRPAKVTKTQAEALLGWITARDYTFYVKDLVDFLKTTHGYKGCDGTVRRALIRAGFRRKEPYRKSEITHWVPPNHPVNFVVIAEDDDGGDDSPHEVDQSPPVAPRAEQPGVTSQAPSAAMHNMSPPQLHQTPQHLQQMTADSMAHSANASVDPHLGQDFRLDPALRSLAPPQPPPPPPPQTPLTVAPSPSQLPPQPVTQALSPSTATASSSKKKRKASGLDDALRHQVNALQNEVIRQNDLIKHLHQQLMQSHAQNISLHHPQPSTTSQFPDQDRAP